MADQVSTPSASGTEAIKRLEEALNGATSEEQTWFFVGGGLRTSDLRTLLELAKESRTGKALDALSSAGAELVRLAIELQKTWGDDEGDDPRSLDALAKIDAALAGPCLQGVAG